MSETNTTCLLIGAPNSGKTYLFNQLSYAKGEVMNYPGSTTIRHISKIQKKYTSKDICIIDTPGIYDLIGGIPEELEVLNTLAEYQNSCIIFVLDCRFASHRLGLLSKLLNKNIPCVVYCNHVQEAGINLEQLHLDYKASFIDSRHPLALKTLMYVVENMQINFNYLQLAPLKTVSKSLQPKLDRMFLHPVAGLSITIIAMMLIFSGIFYIAQPLSNFMESIIEFLLGSFKLSLFYTTYPLFASLISGGILGLGTLLIFTPQIFLLFMIILFIQESGYLARAAVILDPLFQKFGLHGKSFVALLSGFSCAIPAILLTRTITSRKERILTILAVPFMVCSARVPMYAMCVSLLFQSHPKWIAGIVFGIVYFTNICLGLLSVGMLQKFISTDVSSYFLLELPPYRLPSIKGIMLSSFQRVTMFLKNAGPIILSVSLVMWFAMNFPNYTVSDHGERLEKSYIGQIGQFIEPAFKLMGTDWRVGTAILNSFVAREVFVSSITLLLEKTSSNSNSSELIEILKYAKKKDGSPLFSYPSVVALLVFFMIALQCSSTSVMTAKELKSWKVALLQFISMNFLAYSLAVMTYQVLSRI